MKTELEVLVATEVAALGLDLVEVKIGGSKRRPVIDIRLDKVDGTKITVDDCARASRALVERLEGSPLLPDDYVLEVSSPGVERKLNRPDDWRRFIGRTVRITTSAFAGKKELELVGVEGDDMHEVAVLRDKKLGDIRVPLAEVKEARLVFHWKR